MSKLRLLQNKWNSPTVVYFPFTVVSLEELPEVLRNAKQQY